MKTTVSSNIVSITVLVLMLIAATAPAAVPPVINYQGYLTNNSGNPLNATVSMSFGLYAAASGGGRALWSETQGSVTVTDGIFSVLLGGVTPITLDFSQDYWLETTVNGETLSLRQPVVSVGYAFRAEYANHVDDADANPTNELNTSVTFNTISKSLTITDAGGTKAADLSRLTRADSFCADNSNRYVDCGNGTVTDTVTGLIWLKDANCFGQLDYTDAVNAAAGLEHGECGLTDNSLPGDWRLPTKAEWEATIARADALGCTDPNLTNTPGTACYSVGPQPFTGVQSNCYWSSPANEADPYLAWYVDLNVGHVDAYFKSSTLYVWPVR